MTVKEGESRRSGAETREEILRVALDLFTEKGFEGTSTRDISTALGITKSALYYHFPSKEAIASGLMRRRRQDLDELVAWIREQPREPGLVGAAAQRWLDAVTPQGLRGLRFAHANQPVMRRLAGTDADLRSGFTEVVDLLAGPAAGEVERLQVRMVFDTASAALLAARGTESTSDDDVLAAARWAARALAEAYEAARR